MKNYKSVIGFEVHLQPKLKSKMFCSCSSEYFGSKPNTHTCPVCLGLPGALPVPNKVAIEKCIKLALALNCEINQDTKFDRKNYFYPDLPKGYQISQYDKPIGENGYLEFDIEGDSRRIRITRVHMEEDTAKSLHQGEETLIDFNKSGVALIEVVTEPDFESVEEVDKFAKRLRQIIRYLDISEADMEKGQMRYELNISVKEASETKLPNYKVEVKNIASISVLKKVIESETKRQTEILNSGKTPIQETRGLRGMSGETATQRVKENSDDYRYFPEPDIPPISISDEWLVKIRESMIELPQAKKERYMKELGLEPDSAETIVSVRKRYEFFEKCLVDMSKDVDLKIRAPEVAKWIIGDLANHMKRTKTNFANLKVKPSDIVELVAALKSNRISGTIAKNLLEECFNSGKSVESIISEKNLEVINDEGEIQKFVDEVIKANEKIVNDIAKNPNAIKFLVGQVMRVSKGKANAKVVEEMLKRVLSS